MTFLGYHFDSTHIWLFVFAFSRDFFLDRLGCNRQVTNPAGIDVVTLHATAGAPAVVQPSILVCDVDPVDKVALGKVTRTDVEPRILVTTLLRPDAEVVVVFTTLVQQTLVFRKSRRWDGEVQLAIVIIRDTIFVVVYHLPIVTFLYSDVGVALRV